MLLNARACWSPLEDRLFVGTKALEASEAQRAELHRLYQALYSEHGQLSSLHATRGQQIAQLQHPLAGVSGELRLTTGDQPIVKANDEIARLARLSQEQVGALQQAERHIVDLMRQGQEVTQKRRTDVNYPATTRSPLRIEGPREVQERWSAERAVKTQDPG